MRKLKGITINGEWMGDNVAINGLFRAICAISPYVMQEFIRLINKIDTLDEAVYINKFSFPNNNTIEIEVSNRKLHGLANLIFKLQNGTPVLVNGKLILPQKEEFVDAGNTVQVEKPKPQECSDVEPEETPVIEPLAEIEDNKEACSISEIQEDNIEQEIPEEFSEEISQEVKEPAGLEEEITTEDNLADFYEKDEEETQEEFLEKEVADNKQAEISAFVDELINRAPDLTAFAKPIQIQVIQPNIPNAEISVPKEEKKIEFIENNINVKEENKKEFSKEDDVPNAISEEKLLTEPQDEAGEALEQLSVDEVVQEETENSEEISSQNEEIVEDENAVNEDVSFSFVSEDSNQELDDEENAVIDDICEMDSPINCDVDIEADFTEDSSDSDINEDVQNEENNDSSENIDEYLADFYSTENEEQHVDEAVKDNIAMQAMLNEVMVLREELSKLKQKDEEEQAAAQKPTVEEFFGDYRVPYEINDDEADFKIMGNGARINASILDEDMFIAGDKLYRWGETLYLEE